MSVHQLSLTTDQFVEKSKEITGITHIDDDAIREPLDQLLNSLNTESQLNKAGALNAEKRILRVLNNRLRMLRDFEAHPEIDEQEIIGPLVISGLNRTGTTKLQKMLAASGDFHYNKFWHVFNLSLHSGDRDEDPSPRIDETEEFVQWFDQHAPNARYTHYYQTHEVEEEAFVFEHCRFGALMLAFYDVPSFLQWCATQNPVDEYKFLRKSLKYMQWQRYDGESKPWLLKYPFYLGTEDLLLTVFPDAKFVVPHRNLVNVVASSASLLSAYRTAYSNENFDPILAHLMLANLSPGTDRIVALRESQPNLPIMDVRYIDVVADSETTIEKIYDFFGKTLTDESRNAMLQWEQDNQQHKQGAHKYALSDYGLTEDDVRKGCARYYDYFGDLL